MNDVSAFQQMRRILFFALYCAIVLLGCGSVPSRPSGSSEILAAQADDLPRSIAVIVGHKYWPDPARKIFVSGLMELGFTVGSENPDGNLTATFDSDYSPSEFNVSPVYLNVTLAASGQVLWRAKIAKAYDHYTSPIGATESVARKAMEMLRRDLEEIGYQK